MNRSEAGKLGAIALKRNNIKRYEANSNLCECCKSKLSYEKRHNRFCGHSCSAKISNRKRIKRCCTYCKIPTSNQKYCCSICQHKHEWDLKKKEIEAGVKVLYHRNYKRYLLETRGNRCEICGIEEWNTKPAPLIMDHIDGNSDSCVLDNLRLVCGNCDMQLPTYKAKNKGNGRYYRRIRYAEGKSY